MVQQIAVSYLAIIIYCTTIVSLTLLVGILPVYVNPPFCNDVPPNVPLADDSSKPLTDILDLLNRATLPVCIEFTVPEAGIEEPWFNQRLPSNIQPVSYDLDINLSVLDDENNASSYNGFVTITLVVTDATDTFILHKKNLDLVRVESMNDLDDNPIELLCYGEYAKNDYFVFKTLSQVQVSQSPVKIELYFEARADHVYESGLFRIDYGFKDAPKLV